MPAVHWLKVDHGRPYSGAFRQPRDWKIDGSPITVFRDGKGRAVRERIPATGHEGQSIHNMTPLRVRRFLDVLRDDGNVVPLCITTAAAHVPNEDTSYEQDRRHKMRYLGWVEWGKCPAALLATGQINPEMVVAESVKRPAMSDADRAAEAEVAGAWRGEAALPDAKWWGRACMPGSCGPGKPCVHLLQERAARRAMRAAETADREERHKSEESRAQEKQTAALEKLTEQLVAGQLAALDKGPARK